MTLQIDLNQGTDAQDRTFGYVHGDEGGYFFTWMPTLAETLGTLEIDEVDGDGELTEAEARKALIEKIAVKIGEWGYSSTNAGAIYALKSDAEAVQEAYDAIEEGDTDDSTIIAAGGLFIAD